MSGLLLRRRSIYVGVEKVEVGRRGFYDTASTAAWVGKDAEPVCRLPCPWRRVVWV